MWSGLLAIALASGTFQDASMPPPDGSKVYRLGMASDTTGTYAEMKWEWEPKSQEGESSGSNALICRNECVKQIHLLHSQCNSSCDKLCAKKHKGEVFPGFSIWTGGTRDVDNAVRSFGVEESPEAFYYELVSISGIQNVLDGPQFKVKFDFTHWNDRPCSYQFMQVGGREFRGKATLQLFRLNRLADGSEVRTLGPTVTYGMLIFVPSLEKVEKSKPGELCNCSAIIPEDASDETPQVAMTATHQDGSVTGVGPQQIKEWGISVVAEDMNHAEVTIKNCPTDVTSINIPCGYELDCVDGSAQDTQLVENVVVGASGPLLASINPQRATTMSAKMFTMCLEIDKKEPNRKLKYRLKPPTNYERLMSAQIAAASPRRGPWDQVRTWIVTDQATFGRLNEVLNPPPSPATYMRELKRAREIPAIDLSDPKAQKMYDPSLLATPKVEDDVWLDFYRQVDQFDQKGLISWIASSGNEFSEWYDQTESGPVTQVLERLVREAASGSEAHLMAVCDLVLSPALTTMREKISESTALWSIGSRLMGPLSARTMEKIVVTIEAYRHPVANLILLNAPPTLSAAHKTRLSKVK